MTSNFTRTPFVLVALAVSFSGICGQEVVAVKKETPSPCPQLSLNGPGERIIKEGERLPITVMVNGGDPNVTPNFVWTTSGGVIDSGQGTRSVVLDTNGSGYDRGIRVDLWVAGYPSDCSLQSHLNLKVVPPAVRVLEFGELTPEKETAQVEEILSVLRSSTDNVYVLGYAGKTNPRGYVNVVLKRIKSQLLASGLAYERIAFVDAGYREEPSFEIWTVPVGADAPQPKPTVKTKDIVFPKPAAATPAKKQ